MAYRQAQIPGGAYVNQVTTRQQQIPGFQYINENTTSTPAHTLKAVMGILTANIKTINGTAIGVVKTYLGLTP